MKVTKRSGGQRREELTPGHTYTDTIAPEMLLLCVLVGTENELIVLESGYIWCRRLSTEEKDERRYFPVEAAVVW